jgi:hypothetical protein
MLPERNVEVNELILKDFWKRHKDQAQPFNWLRGRSYSDAFVICIGAGPWRFGRRRAIQGRALQILNGRDLTSLTNDEIEDMYPLRWQREFVKNAIQNLHKEHESFEHFCDLCKSPCGTERPGRSVMLRVMLGLVDTNNAKVISLFCRDALKVPSFPIDRHVKRKLIELGLPPNEYKIIELCQKIGIDPCKVAVAFVRAASNMDNPDWSVNDC